MRPGTPDHSGGHVTLPQTVSLNEQSALVTGGASGLGASLCRQLAGRGARVMVADLRENAAQALARQLAGEGLQAEAIGCDVGDTAQAEHAVRHTMDRFGAIDVLVNNAGIDVTCSLAELEIHDWERVLRTNLQGPFVLTRAAARYMMGRGRGQVVNITSTAAKRQWPNAVAYHASKTGLLALSHALHAELRPAGIKVMAVIAGGMSTPFLLDRFPGIDRSALQDPADVALAICELLELPAGTVVPEVTILPMRETSWP
jgi:NAD(P)-dependent dehydrogenase (short-subunit alcohol dehydrogenase family)